MYRAGVVPERNDTTVIKP